MITETQYEQDGMLLVKHVSDKYTLRQVETGIEYDEAIDGVPCPYTYEETTNERVVSSNGEPMSEGGMSPMDGGRPDGLEEI